MEQSNMSEHAATYFRFCRHVPGWYVRCLFQNCLVCRVVVLEDNDVVHLCKGAYGIFNIGHPDRSLAVPRVLQTLEMEVNHIMKGGYDHFMQKEIHEQPESVTETMRGRVKFRKSPERVCLCNIAVMVLVMGIMNDTR